MLNTVEATVGIIVPIAKAGASFSSRRSSNRSSSSAKRNRMVCSVNFVHSLYIVCTKYILKFTCSSRTLCVLSEDGLAEGCRGL